MARNRKPQVDPAEAALLPTLYVKFEEDRNDEESGGCLLADGELETLVDNYETIIGVYTLVGVRRYRRSVERLDSAGVGSLGEGTDSL